jgi:hypothetical protein
MDETSWVRSTYLYLMCIASVALVVVGLGSVAAGLVHAVAPDLGQRDTLDRVGIGLSNVAADVVDLVGEAQQESIERFCEDITDSDDDFDDCVDDQQSFNDDSLDSIQQGIAGVRDELRGQIRSSSIDRILRGIVLTVAGIVVFRIHGRRTELFADGLMPKPPTPPQPPAPAYVAPPTYTVPPAPPAPPQH